MKCPGCGKTMSGRRREAYRYGECGLPNVILRGIEVHECSGCGEQIVSIPRMAELHRVLALAVARQHARLSGAEIRFLRKHLGLSGADFARIMGVDAATVSRWENEKDPMGTIAERLLRLLVVRGLSVEEYPIETLADVAQDNTPIPKFSLHVEKQGWLADAA